MDVKWVGLNGRGFEENGHVNLEGQIIKLEDVSWVRKGDTFAYVVDTRPCKNAVKLAKDATLLLCESTYLNEQKELAKDYRHLTATEAALIAEEANAHELILTHFSARYLDEELFANEARAIFPKTSAAKDMRRFEFPKRT